MRRWWRGARFFNRTNLFTVGIGPRSLSQVEENYAVERITLKAIATHLLPIKGVSVQTPSGGILGTPSAATVADGALPGVTYSFGRPPSSFIFSVVVTERDEITFDCELTSSSSSAIWVSDQG